MDIGNMSDIGHGFSPPKNILQVFNGVTMCKQNLKGLVNFSPEESTSVQKHHTLLYSLSPPSIHVVPLPSSLCVKAAVIPHTS